MEYVVKTNEDVKEEKKLTGTEIYIENKSKVLDNKTKEMIQLEKQFIESKYQELLTKRGIILLNPMEKERRKIIYDIIEESYPDVRAFSIGTDYLKHVVLRYIRNKEERIDVLKLIQEGNSAYKSNDFDKCIECYLQVLTVGKPKSIAYSKLGLSYLKKLDKERAIEYLTIANALSKEEGVTLDYSELIGNLKEKELPEKKIKSHMKEKTFNNDLNNYYGINDFETIHNYIMESGLGIDNACENLNFSESKIVLIKLIYAKQYYAQGEYAIGDQLLQSVEKIKNKNAIIKKELDGIRKSKKFYINRTDKQTKKLSLKIKIK